MDSPIKVTSIGSGNVAWHITKALKKIGCYINQVYSRNRENAYRLGIHLDTESTHRIKDLYMDSDLYLIMVSDDAIKSVVEDLPHFKNSQILAHTSGSVPSTILSLRSENYGSFYPLQSFLKSQDVEISKVPFLVYGSTPSSLRLLRMTATQLSSNVSEINDAERLHYHLSAVFINNFSNHIACIADQYLRTRDLDARFLKPLMSTTFEKIIKGQPCDSQTGPAKRDDQKLMNKHLTLLESYPEWAEVYRSVSNSIINQYAYNK